MTYIRQLDAVRAIAVILVIIHHWLPPGGLFILFPLGGIGVDIFFVLSGFLITRILLVKKESLEAPVAKESTARAVGRFMMRRSLRIFPIYYLMLMLLYFGVSYLPNPMPVDWEYYTLYLQNFLFYYRQSFPGGKMSPFWSLAVEEQFYLIWPWVLFLTPQRYIWSILISGIVIGTVSSVLFPILLDKKALTLVLTPTCLQSFCLGGSLSYLSIKKDKSLHDFYPILRILGLLAIVIYIGIKLSIARFELMDRVLISLFTTWIISVILLSKHGWWSPVFNSKILISIGQVSYGLYVYHNFVPVSVKAMLHYFSVRIQSDIFLQSMRLIENYSVLFYLVCVFVLATIAYASYSFLERPMLRLKKHFE